MEMANTLAYWDTATITAVKSSTVQVKVSYFHNFAEKSASKIFPIDDKEIMLPIVPLKNINIY